MTEQDVPPPTRFSVTRASHSSDDEAPCIGAVPGEARGSYSQWFVDLPSMKELWEFIQREGRVIIHEDASIMIYDDYVE